MVRATKSKNDMVNTSKTFTSQEDSTTLKFIKNKEHDTAKASI